MFAWLQIDVFVKNTSTVPSFQMAYTEPTKDVDGNKTPAKSKCLLGCRLMCL